MNKKKTQYRRKANAFKEWLDTHDIEFETVEGMKKV